MGTWIRAESGRRLHVGANPAVHPARNAVRGVFTRPNPQAELPFALSLLPRAEIGRAATAMASADHGASRDFTVRRARLARYNTVFARGKHGFSLVFYDTA
jgi:hypothetical protein